MKESRVSGCYQHLARPYRRSGGGVDVVGPDHVFIISVRDGVRDPARTLGAMVRCEILQIPPVTNCIQIDISCLKNHIVSAWFGILNFGCELQVGVCWLQTKLTAT